MERRGFMRLIVCLSASLSLVAASAGESFIVRGRVVDTAPIIETVYEPVEVCRYEYVRTETSHRRKSSNTQQKVVGGLIGGAAGSAIGSGDGRDAAAAIGAILGSEVAEGDGISEGEIIGGVVGGIVGNQIGGGQRQYGSNGCWCVDWLYRWR